ncbi:hypothetical protein [Amycolatopsis sp. NPDC049868]|uniref:hypothetical protein n=1 Tax=Amycolatopsis sp. NPDC049868 TaxID=3363934 RepID=UPI0037948136
MPVNTVINGNPDNLHATAVWIRGRLTAAINNTTVTVLRSREISGSSWVGPAAAAFATRMDHIRKGNDVLAGDTTRAADTFDQFAEALRTAQTRMRRVVETAIGAGLHVAGRVIFEPLPAPNCYADPAVQTAANAHQERLLAAYASACEDALTVVASLAAVGAAISAVWCGIVEKRYMLARDFVGLSAEKFTTVQSSKLQAIAQAFEMDPATSQWRGQADIAGQLPTDMARVKGDANLWKTFDRVAAASSIAYDMAHGVPFAKSASTNVADSTASCAAGKVLGRGHAERSVGIEAVAVLDAGGDVIVSAEAGALADATWDQIPKPLRDKIEQGAKDLFMAGNKAVDSCWNSMENTADRVWRLLF